MKAMGRFYLRTINYRGRNPVYLLLQILLYLLSGVYFIFLRMKRAYARRRKIKIDIPVISVGNITWGGTGKTPLVIYLVHIFKHRGKNITVIHHGQRFGDEPELLHRKLPQVEILHSASKKKLLLGLKNRKDVNIVVIDDGFQNWDIHRDLDILVLDSGAPFGNGYLIPRGNLREEPASINRADLIVVNKITPESNLDALEKRIARYNFSGDIVYTCYEIEKIRKMEGGEVLPSFLSERKVALVAGIGHPEYFSYLIQNTGAEIIQRFFYPDHHVYTRQDLQRIEDKLDNKVEVILITEKDEVKFKKIFSESQSIISLPLYVVEVGLRFVKNEQALHRRLDILLGGSGI
ncbi:MAG: tetraacyldisaccharide 4'-kinase [Candidatus Omnitrophota bacterium]|nr:MAG: tetraacyldisaccharide 4'-kinase [Candidatus Omnitrophota bacterium]